MKSTEDIYDDCEEFEINNLREFCNPKDRLTFYNTKWYSEEEIRIALEKHTHSDFTNQRTYIHKFKFLKELKIE